MMSCRQELQMFQGLEATCAGPSKVIIWRTPELPVSVPVRANLNFQGSNVECASASVPTWYLLGSMGTYLVRLYAWV